MSDEIIVKVTLSEFKNDDLVRRMYELRHGATRVYEAYVLVDHAAIRKELHDLAVGAFEALEAYDAHIEKLREKSGAK